MLHSLIPAAQSACMPTISRARVPVIARSAATKQSIRIEPAVEFADKGDLQYLVFECGVTRSLRKADYDARR